MDGLNRLDTAEERFSKLEDKAEEITQIATQIEMKNMKIKSKEEENRMRGYNLLAYVARQKKIIEVTRERQYNASEALYEGIMPKISKNNEKLESLDLGIRANPK